MKIFTNIAKNIRKMRIKAALIDLSGTLHIEDEQTPNAVQALQRLRQTGVQVKFVTNTTKECRQTLYERLKNIGFELQIQEIYSSLSAAVDYIKTHKLNPYYLLSEDALRDFEPSDSSKPLDAVVVGLAPQQFHYESLNKAFNLLIGNPQAKLIAINQGKYYKRKDDLALGAGFFVKGLEYSSGVQPILIGKPNALFFTSALPEGINLDECVMIGDDIKDDVEGAMKVGLRGVLVKTGKYLPTAPMDIEPTAALDNFNTAVDWIIQQNATAAEN